MGLDFIRRIIEYSQRQKNIHDGFCGIFQLIKAFKVWLTALLIAVLFANTVASVYAETAAQLQKKKNEAQSKLDSANDAVNEIAEEKKEAEQEADEIDRQLVQLLAELDILEDELAAKEIQVQEASEKYEQAKAEVEKQYASMKKRIRFMYEKGENQYFEILMQAQSIADAINKADYTEKVYEYDREMLERFQKTKQEAADLYDQLVEEKAQLEGMQVEYKEQQTELEKVLSEKRAAVENFEEKLAAARSEAKRYEAEVKEANTKIAQQVAAQKAAEAKAKAEAEARAKAAAEAAAAANKNNEGEADVDASQAGDDSDSNNDNSNYDESSQEGEYDSGPQNEGNSGGSGGTGGSGTGSQIASFACQFIGNPYVSGGTSLTNGTDCSGFTMSVYSHFGYSIPRTSYAQAAYGRSVSFSEAQPGDIMCYAGHVGIYIGNGMIVHASTPATGIKTTIATYRPILSVRRII